MSAERPLSHWITLARLGFEEDLARLMSKKRILKSDLAKNADVSPPFITKVLGGTNNYTLKTMAKLARAVGAVLEIRLADENGEVVRVVDYETAGRLDAPKINSVRGRFGAAQTKVLYFADAAAQPRRKADIGAQSENVTSQLFNNLPGERHG